MDKVEIAHVPTKEIPKGMNHVLRCKCGNITMACDEPIPKAIVAACKDVPCSECVTPDKYIESVFGKG